MARLVASDPCCYSPLAWNLCCYMFWALSRLMYPLLQRGGVAVEEDETSSEEAANGSEVEVTAASRLSPRPSSQKSSDLYSSLAHACVCCGHMSTKSTITVDELLLCICLCVGAWPREGLHHGCRRRWAYMLWWKLIAYCPAARSHRSWVMADPVSRRRPRPLSRRPSLASLARRSRAPPRIRWPMLLRVAVVSAPTSPCRNSSSNFNVRRELPFPSCTFARATFMAEWSSADLHAGERSAGRVRAGAGSLGASIRSCYHKEWDRRPIPDLQPRPLPGSIQHPHPISASPRHGLWTLCFPKVSELLCNCNSEIWLDSFCSRCYEPSSLISATSSLLARWLA
ncbi:hypothetical protein ZWY2020_015872 [Hordeum vulgare]|nr:hypothetical protein ZWY2020_015872 [Hordeum vulgare]